MPVPNFTSGEVLSAGAMNSVGLWLVKTQTIGATVPSVEVTGAFSSTYDDYLVIVQGGTASAGANMRLQIGNATTGYSSRLAFGAYTSTTASGAVDTTSAFFDWTGHLSSVSFLGQVNIKAPNLAKYTHVYAPFDNGNDVGTMAGVLKNTTQYTSFTVSVAGAGTFSGGTINVYGYRK
jgi:hypothetical protein